MCLVLVVAFSALKASADERNRIFEEFEVVTAVVPEGVELVMLPASAGTGYMVVSQGKEYFLPEGQALTLNADRYYDLQVCRAFGTEEDGLLVMTASTKNIKVGHTIDPSNASPTSDKLFLAEMPKYKNVSPPSLVANMLYGTFTISPVGFWDAIEIVYFDGKRTKTFWYFPKELRINSVPKSKGDTVISVRTVVFDGGRMIVTGAVGVKYTSRRAVAK
jgi:hypothetical protein